MTLIARVLDDAVDLLGEGPTWDAARGVAHWVDIDGGRVFEGTPGPDGIDRQMVYQSSGTVGAAVHVEGGGLLVAAATSLVRLDASGRQIGEQQIVPGGMPSRLNDGACDPDGRYVVGTLAFDERPGGELLCRVEHSGEVTVIDDDLTISNGLGWSPDGGTFYSIDSVPGTVWVRDYDPASGAMGGRHRAFAPEGVPDGMVVDADGNLWIAFWGASELRCYSPAGEVLEVVRTTAPHTTSAAFVGPDLATLLITSAGKSVGGATPTIDAGKLFTVEAPVHGAATTPWRPAF